jgi:hypothetical protein
LTSALALATVVALIGMTGAWSNAPVIAVPSAAGLSKEAANIPLVRELYAAANEALRPRDMTHSTGGSRPICSCPRCWATAAVARRSGADWRRFTPFFQELGS